MSVCDTPLIKKRSVTNRAPHSSIPYIWKFDRRWVAFVTKRASEILSENTIVDVERASEIDTVGTSSTLLISRGEGRFATKLLRRKADHRCDICWIERDSVGCQSDLRFTAVGYRTVLQFLSYS